MPKRNTKRSGRAGVRSRAAPRRARRSRVTRSGPSRRGTATRRSKPDGAPSAARFDARATLSDFGVVKREPTPPVVRKPGPKPGKREPRRVLITSFRARGSIEGRFRKSPGGMVERENARARYFELQSEAPELFPNSPGVWASNEGLFLGQVNFAGRVPRLVLERMLNISLGLVDKRGRVRDFRDVYKRWEIKYQVFEKVGTERRILERYRDSNGGGR